MSLARRIEQTWYNNSLLSLIFIPLSWVYGLVANYRRRSATPSNFEPVIIVVGNITVGGTGKTPFISYLSRLLTQRGYSVGLVSRGYGAKRHHFPHRIQSQDSAEDVGDEPMLLFQETGLPTVIDPNRPRAVSYLIEQCQGGLDVVLSDDGLQHYALGRDLELALIDGDRGLGNGRLLPAGPCRENPDRLKKVDFCLLNGESARILPDSLENCVDGNFSLVPCTWIELHSGRKLELDDLPTARRVQAFAAIGNPQRFFNTLESLGVNADCQEFADHQALSVEQLQKLGAVDPDQQLLMTTKDAVKCRAILENADLPMGNCWALKVKLRIDDKLEERILNRVEQLIGQRRLAQGVSESKDSQTNSGNQ